MSTNRNLENELSKLKHQFNDGFEGKVMQAIQDNSKTEEKVLKLWGNRTLLAAAASVAVLLLSTLYSNGNISSDGLIGLEEYNILEVGETYITYNDIYHE